MLTARFLHQIYQVDMLTMNNIIACDTLFIYFIIIIYTVDMKCCEVIERKLNEKLLQIDIFSCRFLALRNARFVHTVT